MPAHPPIAELRSVTHRFRRHDATVGPVTCRKAWAPAYWPGWWSNHGFTATVSQTGDFDLGTQALTVDGGTGATGTVAISGTARCAA